MRGWKWGTCRRNMNTTPWQTATLTPIEVQTHSWTGSQICILGPAQNTAASLSSPAAGGRTSLIELFGFPRKPGRLRMPNPSPAAKYKSDMSQTKDQLPEASQAPKRTLHLRPSPSRNPSPQLHQPLQGASLPDVVCSQVRLQSL